MKQIRINEHGNIDPNGRYLVTLTGSYRYSHLTQLYVYEVFKCEPKMPISAIFSKELI